MADSVEASSTHSIASSMPSSPPAVHIVYTETPPDENPKDFHIRTLASALGSEEAAKDALVYSYKTAVGGFSAKLTPDQVSRVSRVKKRRKSPIDNWWLTNCVRCRVESMIVLPGRYEYPLEEGRGSSEKEEEKAKWLVDELYGLPGLSSVDALEIFLMLFDNVQKTDCFLSLHMNKKYEYCMDLLGRRS
ncbi:subtilisin-like protease SBT3.5 isoform X1 [Cucumis melo var. makuwa]|uniref:Subtilisin-like protease SBT3.5 isoform X1 n=1 Tax=Cucumis melo var. makuwa TaxID=1194695 RepID=A0A5A7T617_CUCMM|nr:subtilisin-like protease SBT3.5 isoform X1 [Cucumis melo var. makuwa]TYK06644.1 subtilisin-like protease SBT3.5 isoform X1 [Cucumis melo var. makuwa]